MGAIEILNFEISSENVLFNLKSAQKLSFPCVLGLVLCYLFALL